MCAHTRVCMFMQLGLSCVHLACERGNLDVVKFLSERGEKELIFLQTNSVSLCMFVRI
jgi:hypothetical protein